MSSIANFYWTILSALLPSYSSCFTIYSIPKFTFISLVLFFSYTYAQHEELAGSSPSARRLLDALSVLATVQKSSLVNLVPPATCLTPLIHGVGSAGTPGRTLNKDASVSQSQLAISTGDTVNSSIACSNEIGNNNSWTFGERIAVLAGLCEVLKASPAAADVFTKVQHNRQITVCHIILYCATRCSMQSQNIMQNFMK